MLLRAATASRSTICDMGRKFPTCNGLYTGPLALSVKAFCRRSLPTGSYLVFLDDGSRIFVFSKCAEARVTERVVGFHSRTELRDGLGMEPNAVPHLGGRQTLTPAPYAGSRRIDEWASFGLQRCECA